MPPGIHPLEQLLSMGWAWLQLSSVAQSCATLRDPMDCSTPGHPVHHQLPEFTQTHVHRVSHPTISFSVVPCSSCLQCFPASESSPMSQFFASRPNWSFSFSISPSNEYSKIWIYMNIQDWFPLGHTGWISLQFKGLSRVFSNTTVQKHQLFGTQLSL